MVEIYRREMVDPLLAQIRRLATEARKSGELRGNVLVENPHLLIAPIWMGIINNELLDKSHPLDIGRLFELQLDLAFGSAVPQAK